jgi:hypothetical protein
MDAYARYQRFDKHAADPIPKAPTGPLRQIINLSRTSTAADVVGFAGTGPRQGDILIIGKAGPGQHITVVDSFDPKSATFVAYSGNGYGVGPDGARRDGVSVGTYRVGQQGGAPDDYIAIRLWRPGFDDVILS